MPHSTQNSVESRQTFDLTGQDRPVTPRSDSTMPASSRPSGDMFGNGTTTATPSPPNMIDPRSTLPSQQDVLKLRRRSMPGTVNDFVTADMFHQNGQLEGVIGPGRSGAYRVQGPPMPNMPAAPIMPGLADRSYSYNDMARQRTQYYEQQFQDNTMKSTRDKVHRQSPVIAELRTNVIIKDEFTLVTDLSYQLAQRYTRPDSSIMIRVDHSACLALGGTFDPCYMLTINAVSSQMGPSTNKRNAALIQSFMADILSVPAERGIVTFVPIPEENLATCGNTILGEMEKAEKQDPGLLMRTTNGSSKNGTQNRKSMSRFDQQLNGNGILKSSASVKDLKHDSDESDKTERPRTAHGVPANGLRMNPVSQDELRAQLSRTPPARPKSIGAPTAAMQEMLKQQPREPIPVPNLTRQSTAPGPRAPVPQRASQQLPPRAQSANSVTQVQKPKHIPINISRSATNTSLAPRPVQPNAFLSQPQITPFNSAPTTMTRVTAPTSESARSKAVYMDMVSALPIKSEPNILKVTEFDPSKQNGDTIAAANMAKRRSTLTSTPKAPPVPPEPQAIADDSKSMTSRLGKRKSFLKIFKRESIPPWYKQ